MSKMPDNWQATVEKVQRYRNDTLDRLECPVPETPEKLPYNVTGLPRKLLTAHECDITETLVEDLIERISQGHLSSLEVVRAYLRRAALAQRLVNCITELLPERAIARAKYLDDYYATHGTTIGPLHGVPISVKEHISMKDLDVNLAFVSWVGKKVDNDAHLLKILWAAGCVFYARTTEPQTIMHLETSSNLYGVTTNPFNTRLTSGGSSGGEGALIGLRGSSLGIATDIGGSIRSPAANNGLYGFKPTTFRLPMGGHLATMLGSEHIVPVVGPISTSLAGIRLFMKVIINAKPHFDDPSLIPIPWRDDVSHLNQNLPIKLRIGVMWTDGVVTPHPPVIRAMKEVMDQLKTAPEIAFCDWKPWKHDLGWEIISSLYFPDNADDEIAGLEASGEPWMPLTDWIINEGTNRKQMTVAETWAWQRKRNQYRNDYNKLWMDTATSVSADGYPEGMVDVILCPAGPGAAPPLNCARYWPYTSQWNLLDYPALIFPVTMVDPEKDLKNENYDPINEQDQYNYDLYQPEIYRDAPVTLQLVGRRYDDEKVIEALELIKRYVEIPNMIALRGK